MVPAEKQTMKIAADSKKRDAQQGRSRQIETRGPDRPRRRLRVEPHDLRPQIAPILLFDWEHYAAMDTCCGFQALPTENELRRSSAVNSRCHARSNAASSNSL